MKVYEILNEDGRIVKGVNTTVDVGVGQIPIEAAKFGSKVDKDGRPPTLSKRVKGKSTNVLFNLGLTESVKLQFQRGDDFDTLHIKPKNKNRVELRGKPGYESGGYDAQDKLHQVLDRLGKAANFAELMNGEVVTINPKHPDGERAKNTVDDVLSTENFDPVAWLRNSLSTDPQYKAWMRMYKQDPKKAKLTFGKKHFEFLSQYQGKSTDEDQHPNERPLGPETKPTMPAGSIRVKVSDVYDWYKLGQHISDLAHLDHNDFGKGPPEAVIAFGSEEEEHKYIKLLQKLGLEILDVDPGAPDAKGVEADPTYNTEGFASDAQRRAAFANGYKPKGKKKSASK